MPASENVSSIERDFGFTKELHKLDHWQQVGADKPHQPLNECHISHSDPTSSAISSSISPQNGDNEDSRSVDITNRSIVSDESESSEDAGTSFDGEDDNDICLDIRSASSRSFVNMCHDFREDEDDESPPLKSTDGASESPGSVSSQSFSLQIKDLRGLAGGALNQDSDSLSDGTSLDSYLSPPLFESVIDFSDKFLNGAVVMGRFRCALKSNILLQGKLYITQDAIGFYSRFNDLLVGGPTSICIPLERIKTLRKSKNAVIFDNSIEIETFDEEFFFFTSFLNRNEAFKTIKLELKNAVGANTGNSSSGSSSLVRGEGGDVPKSKLESEESKGGEKERGGRRRRLIASLKGIDPKKGSHLAQLDHQKDNLGHLSDHRGSDILSVESSVDTHKTNSIDAMTVKNVAKCPKSVGFGDGGWDGEGAEGVTGGSAGPFHPKNDKYTPSLNNFVMPVECSRLAENATSHVPNRERCGNLKGADVVINPGQYGRNDPPSTEHDHVSVSDGADAHTFPCDIDANNQPVLVKATFAKPTDEVWRDPKAKDLEVVGKPPYFPVVESSPYLKGYGWLVKSGLTKQLPSWVTKQKTLTTTPNLLLGYAIFENASVSEVYAATWGRDLDDHHAKDTGTYDQQFGEWLTVQEDAKSPGKYTRSNVHPITIPSDSKGRPIVSVRSTDSKKELYHSLVGNKTMQIHEDLLQIITPDYAVKIIQVLAEGIVFSSAFRMHVFNILVPVVRDGKPAVAFDCGCYIEKISSYGIGWVSAAMATEWVQECFNRLTPYQRAISYINEQRMRHFTSSTKIHQPPQSSHTSPGDTLIRRLTSSAFEAEPVAEEPTTKSSTVPVPGGSACARPGRHDHPSTSTTSKGIETGPTTEVCGESELSETSEAANMNDRGCGFINATQQVRINQENQHARNPDSTLSTPLTFTLTKHSLPNGGFEFVWSSNVVSREAFRRGLVVVCGVFLVSYSLFWLLLIRLICA